MSDINLCQYKHIQQLTARNVIDLNFLMPRQYVNCHPNGMLCFCQIKNLCLHLRRFHNELQKSKRTIGHWKLPDSDSSEGILLILFFP